MDYKELKEIMCKEGNFYCFKSEDYVCLCIRIGVGHWCGYVGVNKKSTFYKKEYFKDTIFNSIDVHGGITFTDKLACWNIDDRWFVGFDTAHASSDLILWMVEQNIFFPNAEYRNLEYVKKETLNLAKQLLKKERSKKNDK